MVFQLIFGANFEKNELDLGYEGMSVQFIWSRRMQIFLSVILYLFNLYNNDYGGFMPS